MKSVRDLEYDYLSVSYQLEDVLQRKTAAYGMHVELSQIHNQLAELGAQIIQPDCPRDREYDYLVVCHKMQELLQEKTKAYQLVDEFRSLYVRLVDLGRHLRFDEAAATGPETGSAPGNELSELNSRLRTLQQQIDSMRSTMA